MALRTKSAHVWRFYRAGGVDQVELSTGKDIERLADLDQKLWMALACPTRGLHIDERSLRIVDVDGDGRIRPPDILASISWARQVFRSLDDLFEGKDEVPLASIDERTSVGRDVLAGAKRILSNLGKPSASVISLADVADTEKIFSATKLNGDGIVAADSTDDEPTHRAIEDVITVMGALRDRSGKPGVDAAKVEAFFARAQAWADWLAQAESHPDIRPLGDATAAAAGATAAVASKIDDYFVRCQLCAYDDRVPTQVGAAEAMTSGDWGTRELAPEDEGLGKWPIARPAAGRPLPLVAPINPAWAARLAAFRGSAVAGLLGGDRTQLTATDWATLQARLTPWQRWQASRPADPEIQKLDEARIRELVSSDARRAMLDLIERDAALATESNQIESVERVVRLRRDLVPLLRNYVNFSQFYQTRMAAFQVGVLYVDGRSCDLCLAVDQVARHATLASLAHAYLAYCECTRRKDGERRTIVAAVTAGDVDNLMVGRNGVFYDRAREDWDATITRIVENPISIGQAFWSPYKRLIRFIEQRIASRAAAAEQRADKGLQANAANSLEAAAHAGDSNPAAGGKADKTDDGRTPSGAAAGEIGSKMDIGTVAAIGVAVGGIATFLSSVIATVLGLGLWMPVGFLALLLAVSGPSMLIAWLKLRQRNIGPLLDANGWAVNAFARMNVPFGRALTAVAVLPQGASRSLVDPFAEKRRPWGSYFLLLLVVAGGGLWLSGKLDRYLPAQIQEASVLHEGTSPAATPPAATGAGAR